MKIIAIIYLAVIVIGIVSQVFQFDEEREPITPKSWLIGVITISPLIYFLVDYIMK